jgi:hypothetical protein
MELSIDLADQASGFWTASISMEGMGLSVGCASSHNEWINPNKSQLWPFMLWIASTVRLWDYLLARYGGSEQSQYWALYSSLYNLQSAVNLYFGLIEPYTYVLKCYRWIKFEKQFTAASTVSLAKYKLLTSGRHYAIVSGRIRGVAGGFLWLEEVYLRSPMPWQQWVAHMSLCAAGADGGRNSHFFQRHTQLLPGHESPACIRLQQGHFIFSMEMMKRFIF